MNERILKLGLLLALVTLGLGCTAQLENDTLKIEGQDMKMKAEIWSDVVCPWCYIGKRRFEEALNNFEYKEFVEVEYKSYQLDPEMDTDTSITIHQYLSHKKGVPMEQAHQMTTQVTQVASSVGLTYNLDRTIPINTLQAHALLHFAKTKNKQIELKERMLHAYFTETLNLDDTTVLLQLISDIGLDRNEAKTALETEQFKEDVQADINTGVQLGLRGVPFYVFNRKYGVAGAQDTATFSQMLEKSFSDWSKENPGVTLEIIDGKVCSGDGECSE